MYLAIDTSTDSTGLAIIRRGEILAEDNWVCRQNQSVELLPHLELMLRGMTADIQDISGVIVARGPGSFNGLRVGLGTAKGLAFALNVPIAGISTLAAIACQYASAGRPVCAMLPAGRTEAAWAVYRLEGGGWRSLVPETVTGLDDIAAAITEPTVLAGELAPAALGELQARLGDRALILPPGQTRARALAGLGEKRLAAGDVDDVAALQPLYLRRPPITMPKARTEIILPPAKPAVIWDMDGVIVDSAPEHFRAWQTVFSERGVSFSQADFRENFGRVNRDIIGHFLGPEAAETEIATLAQEKENIYRQLAAAERIQLLPGVLDLLQGLHRQHIKQALASSAPRENIELILDMHDLNSYFQATVSAADVSLGKPDPQVFLTAARRLEAEPCRCVVIEDAVAGVAGGKAAGMKVIAVTTTNKRDKLAQADLVVDSLAEISAADVIALAEKSK